MVPVEPAAADAAAAEVAHSSGVETERVSLVDAAEAACSSSLAASWSSLECPLSLEVSLSLSESSDDSDFFSFFSSSSASEASEAGTTLDDPMLSLMLLLVVGIVLVMGMVLELFEFAAAAAAMMC